MRTEVAPQYQRLSNEADGRLVFNCKKWPLSTHNTKNLGIKGKATRVPALFELISQRFERGATLITSNLPFDEWTETLGSERPTGALLHCITYHVNILEMNGDSYRLTQSRARRAG